MNDYPLPPNDKNNESLNRLLASLENYDLNNLQQKSNWVSTIDKLSRFPHLRPHLSAYLTRGLNNPSHIISAAYLQAINTVAESCFADTYLETLQNAREITRFYRDIFKNLAYQARKNPQKAEDILKFTEQNIRIEQKMADPFFVDGDLETDGKILTGWQDILLCQPHPDNTKLEKVLQIWRFNQDISQTLPTPDLWLQTEHDIKRQCAALSDDKKKSLHWLVFSSPLTLTEKKLMAQGMLEHPQSVDPATYIAIRNYIVQSSCQPENAEQWTKENSAWLYPAAFACCCLYGKNFLQYFNIIQNYNRTLPKRQAEMPVKQNIYAQKAAYLKHKYEALQFMAGVLDKHSADKNTIRALTEENLLNAKENLHPDTLTVINKRLETFEHQTEFDAASQSLQLRKEAQSILGSIFSIVNYIDYRNLTPISMEKATAWMLKAADEKNSENIRRYFDHHLKACNAVGQIFLRIDTPHYAAVRINSLEDAFRRMEETAPSDDFSLLANRLKYLKDNELDSMTFGEVYNRFVNMKFCARIPEFLQTISRYVPSQKDYETAERIFMEGNLTPPRFGHIPAIYNSDHTYRCRVAPKDDPRTLFIGHYTSSCQSYGDMGAKCAIDSLVNPYSGCLLFEQKDGDSWKICGCSWFYESQNGPYKALTFDNVEVLPYKTDGNEIYKIFISAVKEFARNNYRSIHIGNNSDIPVHAFPQARNLHPLPEGYPLGGYTDAKSQRILFDNPRAVPETLDDTVLYSRDIFDVSVPQNDDFRQALKLAECFNSRYLRMKDGFQLCGLAVWNDFAHKNIIAVDQTYASAHPEKMRKFYDYVNAYGSAIPNCENTPNLPAAVYTKTGRE